MNLALCGCLVNGDLNQCWKSMRLMLHDLAQPLSVMAGTVDLLILVSDPDSRQFDDIKHLSDQLQVAIDKINEIRELAKEINSSMESLG